MPATHRPTDFADALVLALRSGIHLYYGWGGVFVVPWMIGAVLLYRALRSIWPLVIGHIIYDILVDLRNRLPLLNDVIAVALWGFVVAGVLIVVLSIIRRRQRVLSLIHISEPTRPY